VLAFVDQGGAFFEGVGDEAEAALIVDVVDDLLGVVVVDRGYFIYLQGKVVVFFLLISLPTRTSTPW
jgi:hypothetical protein